LPPSRQRRQDCPRVRERPVHTRPRFCAKTINSSSRRFEIEKLALGANEKKIGAESQNLHRRCSD